MRRASGWMVLGLLVLAGCDGAVVAEDAGDHEEPAPDAGALVDGGSEADAGGTIDAGPTDTVDAGPCGGCGGDTPLCDEITGSCVGCFADTDCAEPTPLCDPTSRACVACLADAECVDDDRCTVDVCDAGACTNELEPMCVRQIDAGGGGTCVRHADGTVACWGDNRNGALGDGTSTSRHTPTMMLGVTDAVDVSTSKFHTCIVTAGGDVRCTGAHNSATGRLGIGAARYGYYRTVQSIGFTDVVEVAAGANHSCARHADGTVSCWGSDEHGQLGDGPPLMGAHAPVRVDRVSEAIGIAVGREHSCAVEATGFVSCWGAGSFGQIGWGSTLDVAYPRYARDLVDAEVIRAGSRSTFALRAGGVPSCWGHNGVGQLGTGDSLHAYQPQPMLVSTARDIQAGGGFACALRPSGQVSCWGGAGDGALGDGTNTASRVPRDVVGLSDAIMLSAGAGHACAVRASGAVVCWGSNMQGQLGDGTTTPSSVPVPVVGYPAP